MSQYSKDCSNFFASPAGAFLLQSVNDLIQSQHTQAENQPEFARDYVQRAKGVREVLQLIGSITAERPEPTKITR